MVGIARLLRTGNLTGATILWSVLWLLVSLNGSIQQKERLHSTAKWWQGRVRAYLCG